MIRKFLFILLLLLPLTSMAERQLEKSPAGLKLYIPEQSEKITTARNLINQKRFQSAGALLETVYEEAPESEVIYSLLTLCYSKLGQWNKLEEITRRFIILFPENYRYHLSMAEALGHLGRTDKSINAYVQALDLIDTVGIGAVNMIFDKMILNGQGSAALPLIDSLRSTEQYDSTAFAFQKGKVLENEKKYGAAASEYFNMLDSDGRGSVLAERRLHALLSFEDSSPDVEAVVMAKTKTNENGRAFKLLTSYYLKSNDYEMAALYAVKQDSAEGYKGQTLYNFMRACKEKKMYKQSIWMGTYIRRQYQDDPGLSQVYFMLAEALTALEFYDEALSLYDSLAMSYSVKTIMADVLYLKGEIYLEYLDQFDRAISSFDSTITYYPYGVAFINSLLSAPKALIAQGNLSEARDRYQKIGQRSMNDESKEEVAYFLGLCEFFEKKFDSAANSFQKLVVDFPNGFYINDALDLVMQMDAAESDSVLLSDYSEALFFKYKKQPDSTKEMYERLASAENKALADLAGYRLGMIWLARADTTAALEQFDLIADQYSDSYYLPFAMKEKADILSESNNTLDEALEIYKRLLESYSDYRFIPEVRLKVRQFNII